MNLYRPSCAVVVALVATQILGPAVLWAADQRGIRVEANRRMIIAAISGDQLAAQSSGNTKALHFLETVTAGDQLATGDRTIAEVLIGNRAVVTLGQSTIAQFTAVGEQVATVQVTKGIVRVAASAAALGEQGTIVVHTPTGQVQTRGGIIRVMVDAPLSSGEPLPIGEARPYRASYDPSSMVVAAVSTRGEIIQVEEGTAEIPGAGPGGRALTVQSGQSVTIHSGQAGSIAGLVSQGGLRAGILASASHSSTPKEGLEHLVALQVNQATALGKALTGAAETGTGQSGGKEDGRNALNGATGGVTLASNSLVISLFGAGSTANISSNSPQERPGAGYGGHNSTGFTEFGSDNFNLKVNGSEKTLLVFTAKDPVAPYNIAQSPDGVLCKTCFVRDFSTGVQKVIPRLLDPITGAPITIVFKPFPPSIPSQFTVAKELVLIGGESNIGHAGVAPDQTLIVRGAAAQANVQFFTNLASTVESPQLANGLYPSDSQPVFFGGGQSVPSEVVAANSTFVVESPSTAAAQLPWLVTGGTLSQFSNRADGLVLHPSFAEQDGSTDDGRSFVDGAITATGMANGDPVVLQGGVTLDRGTVATIGTTEATDSYFSNANLSNADTKYSGSLLAIINGPNGSTSLTMQDRMLGVYDGSTISIGTDATNKSLSVALLSVLDAQLIGPASGPLIDIDAAFLDADKDKGEGRTPNVTVTSAVVTRSTIQLDGALLTASAPLLALTNATMTTTNHFADLAGKENQSLAFNGSLVRGDSLVALNAATLTIGTIGSSTQSHLLNLNNATASITGYLFSLIGGSTLNLNNGTLFSLTGDSSLNLNSNAFGVFGSGNNTLSIANNLCPAGACGQLVNSANQPFLVNGGTPLQVAGVTHNVVLPNSFNVFALVPGAPIPHVNIGATDALFQVDGTSTLTINGATIVQ